MADIIVSAPGKIILHGEHAVVYGKPAIATSLNLRSYLKLTPTNTNYVSVDLSIVNLHCKWEISQLQAIADQNKVNLQEPESVSDCLSSSIQDCISATKSDSEPLTDIQKLAATTFLYLYTALCQSNGSLPSLHVKVVSKLPVGAGLGSSASFSVCLTAAFLLHQGHVTVEDSETRRQFSKEHLELINKWAYQGETIIHGRPSGIDNSVATYGGALLFQSGQLTHLDSMPKLRILLTSTGVPRSTKTLVSEVRDKYEKFPEIITAYLTSIGGITERCKTTYSDMVSKEGDLSTLYGTLEELIRLNQNLLRSLGVSHDTLDKICHVTSKYKLSSKLTGAGGGGCAFTLLRPETSQETLDAIRQDLEPMGFSCWETDIGGQGVLVNGTDFPDS